jgi:translation initiation factor IF-2
MSSFKDTMERLQKGASTPQAARPAVADSKAAPATGDRVSAGVVRRRPPEPVVAAPPPPPQPAARTVIRRPGAAVTPVAEVRPVVAARPVTPVVAPPAAPPEPVVVQTEPVVETVAVEPAAVEPAVVEAPGPAPVEAATAVEPEPVVEAQPTPPAPVVEAAAPEAVAAVVQPEVETVAAPVVAVVEASVAVEPTPAPVVEAPPAPVRQEQPTLDRAVIIERPGGAHRPPAVVARPPMARLPDTPMLPGLGRGVIALPPGFDPTDPTGRRGRPGLLPGATRWTPPGSVRPAGPGRTDVPAPPAPGVGDAKDRKKGRRPDRTEHTMSEFGKVRKPKGKGKGMSMAPAVKIKRRISIDGDITVANLAHEMGVKGAELIKLLMQMGTPATLNQMIDFGTAEVLAAELGHEVYSVAFDEAEHLIKSEAEDTSKLVVRAPVVTVMGHVDHGKTTLLDGIRKAKVAAGEAGGITQHIGAYQVKSGDRLITFLDTPGHAAFSAMRARGAKATDVVILVVAADDGVMPQTIEAINHAKAAKVPIVVAVNKIDKPGVNPERIKQTLMAHGIVAEDFGGDTIFCPVSALKGTGIADLLENVLVTAEVLDLRANPERHGEGVVLEARLEVGRGAVVTLLVQNGTLRQGDILVIGNTWGRVRSMSDDTGRKIKEAGPSQPVEIFGLQDVPAAGADFVVVETEKDARTLAEHRADQARIGAMAQAQRQKMTVDDLYKQSGVALPIHHVVIKTDVGGTLEALKGALEGISIAGTQLKILHTAIGPVTESDITLAAGNGAVVIAFNVKADAKARAAADQYGVEIKRYDVIYHVIDEVKSRMLGLLPTVYEERKTGEAEVRQIFKVSKVGTIAGSMVLDGEIVRGAIAKVTRDGKVVHEGKIQALKRFKDDVKKVDKGFECGIFVEDFETIAAGDIVTCFVRVEVPRTE